MKLRGEFKYKPDCFSQAQGFPRKIKSLLPLYWLLWRGYLYCYNLSLRVYQLLVRCDRNKWTSDYFSCCATHYFYISNQRKRQTCWDSDETQSTFRWRNALKDPGVWNTSFK